MKLVVLVTLFGLVAGSTYKLDDLKVLVHLLQDDLQGLASDLSDAQTMCAVVDEYLDEIYDFFIPKITTANAEHDLLIGKYKQQVKELQHRVDEAKGQEKRALSLASSTKTSLDRQINDYLNGSKVKGVTDHIEEKIKDLESNLSMVKEDFLTYLNTSLDNLSTYKEEVKTKIVTLDDFVERRKCEYGFRYVPVEMNFHIGFKTPFDGQPNVTISLVGFQAHTDLYGHHEYDVLSFHKEVAGVSTDGFYVNVYDDSKGQIKLKYVACTYMACQYLGTDIDIGHE